MIYLKTMLIATLVIASFFSIQNTQAGFNAINDYLTKHVDNKDVGKNMEAAVDWLVRLESAKHSKIFSRALIRDLRKFTSLQQVIDDSRCDSAAYEIMRVNQWTAAFNLVKRVNLVIDDILRQHAERCSGVYPSVFAAKRDQFDVATYERVRAIGDSIMRTDMGCTCKEQKFHNLRDIMDRYAFERYEITNSDHGNPLRGVLKALAKGDLDVIYLNKLENVQIGHMIVFEEKIRKLYERYLIKPCKEYVAQFGMGLFISARFEAYYYLAKPDPAKRDFYYGWAYFTLCQSLINHKHAVFHDIVNSVDKLLNEEVLCKFE